jgi:hypothetical protein
MMLRIPKLRKENYPERAKKRENRLFHGFRGESFDISSSILLLKKRRVKS